MRKPDSFFEPVLVALATAMQALEARYYLIGALVPELLLDVPPPRRTNDADAVVLVPTLEDFERIKEELKDYGFRALELPHRLVHRSGGRLDLLPYSPELAPHDTLELAPELTFTVTGFDQIARAAIEVELSTGHRMPLVPVPLYVLLKLVAFSDRVRWKDPAGAVWCLYQYAADDDRRFGLEHGSAFVPYEFTTAYLTGLDARPYFSSELRRVVEPVLRRLEEDIGAAETIAAEVGWRTVEGDSLHPIGEAFRWFRAGLGD
jgi:predicted nucleotidyltransferase